MKLILCFFIIILIIGCDDSKSDDYNVYVKNASGQDIYACCGYFYPDTTFQRYIYKPEIKNNSKNIALPYNRVFVLRPEIREDTLSVFIISSDAMEKCSWNDIASDYNILCRYDLSSQDILQLDYTIPYPPSPAMKDMKMYPPYEEVIKQEKGL